ncbi:MAG: FAD/NAD(P)-binding oxidoreductase [Bacteroidota bacterium]
MHVVIIGNGISGITTARFVRKLDSNAQITVISAETDHFFSRTALMYIYMGQMRFEDTKPYEDWFWDKNRIELLRDYVSQIDTGSKTLTLSNTGSLKYDKLVLAVGSTPNKFGWPGQDLNRVNGLYAYQDLEAMEAASEGLQRAVIVGGGLIGIEMAEMFHSRHIPVTLLVRESSYWNNVLPAEESAMVSRHIKANNIDLRLGEELKEIVDDGNGNACAVITKGGERIDCGYVGLTAGVRPNIAFLQDTPIETARGILVNNYLETSISDVYAVGDCAQIREPRPGRRPIEAVWYTGRMAGETAAYNICGKSVPYDPGIWFNSAKFIDIEYQVYGDVRNAPQEGEVALYWEHPDGEKSIRILYKKKDKTIVGFNLMGVRYRHEVCEKWIKNGTNVEDVLQDLKLANFDPEFFEMYEDEIIRRYNQQSGARLKSRKKRSLRQVLSFLRG